MARKIVFVFFLIIVVVSIWFKQSQQSPAKQQSEHKQPVVEQQTKPPKVKPKISPSSMMNNELEQTNQAILNEIRNRKYSDDDFIELVSIVYQRFFCEAILGSVDSKKSSEKAAEILALSKQKCDQNKTDYPALIKLLKGKDIAVVYHYLLSIPTFEPEGEILKSLMSDQGQMGIFDEKTTLSTKNPPLILLNAMADFALGGDSPFYFGKMPEVTSPNLLHTLDVNYQWSVNGLAKILIACSYRNDQLCAATGTFMATQCVDDERVCGLNVSQWYQKFIMPGMKKDVEIMLQYYKSITEE